MSHVVKFTRSVDFHFDVARKLYGKYLKLMSFPKKERFSAMDIGCGSGRMLLEILCPLLPRNCCNIVGIDADKAMINHCKSLKVDPNISFQHLKLDCEQLPQTFVNKFDVLFSSYTLHHLRNMQLGLRNCYNMLKQNGEFLFMFDYPGNPFFRINKEINKIDEWKPYTKTIIDYVPFLSEIDPAFELKNLFAKSGFQLINCELRPDQDYEATVEQFKDLFHSMNIIHRTIPQDKEKSYRETFNRIAFKEFGGLSADDVKDLRKKVRMKLPLAVVCGKKINENVPLN